MDVLDQEELDYVLGREGRGVLGREEAGGRAGDRVLDGRAGVLVLREPVGRVLDDEEGDGARVRLEGFESGPLVAGRVLKSGLGSVRESGRLLVSCWLELEGSGRVDRDGRRAWVGC